MYERPRLEEEWLVVVVVVVKDEAAATTLEVEAGAAREVDTATTDVVTCHTAGATEGAAWT